MNGFTTTPKDFAVDGSAFWSYDDRLALATAEHAIAVYRDSPDYDLAIVRAGFRGGTVISKGSAQVGVAYSDEVIVISPRGSSELLDWVVDFLSVVRVGWDYLPKGCRIGWGFKRQALRLIAPLLEYLETIRPLVPNARVVIDGHSLGGALVPILVVVLNKDFGVVDVAYPHSSPRVGNEPWARWYDETFTEAATPTYSVVNVLEGEPDLVTRIPKRRWGFRHVGRRVVHVAGSVLHGDDAWQKYRAENPVGSWMAIRIVTRSLRAIRAHFGASLLHTLRARVAS